MESTILLDSDENVVLVEEQESSRFIRSMLETMGIDLSEIWVDEKLDINQKIKLRHVLSQYQVKIIDDSNHTLNIYLNQDLIAKWHKPKYVIRYDNSETDSKKRFFIEMKVKYESIFENDGGSLI
jgi:hypothetical protein